jgi:lia operon protein LiaF
MLYREKGFCLFFSKLTSGRKKRRGSILIFSVILLVIGIALLLINIGVISLEIKELFVTFIPILFILAGILYFVQSIRRKSSGSIFLSLFFLLYGFLLEFNHYGIVHFTYGDWWKLWPIFFIYLAIKKLFFKEKVKISFEADFDNKHEEILGKTKRKFNKSFTLIGDMEFNKQNWPLKSMDMHNLIGDYYFDFSKAFIPEEETTIIIKSRIGDVKLLIPEDIPTRIVTKIKIGDIRLFDMNSAGTKPHLVFESSNYHDSIKKIDIMIEVGIGDIRIDRI